MGLLFITRFWPWMSEMVQRIPNKVGKSLTIVIAVLLSLDMALSAAAVWRANERHRNMAATSGVERLVDEAFPDDVMARKYPSIKFV